MASIPSFESSTGRSFVIWRSAQVLVFVVGVALVTTLILWPSAGILAFWNVLIPVAPMLLVVAPGLWRNICPLGTFALLPSHFGWSRRKRLSLHGQARFQMAAVVMLYLIVPIRHLYFNTNGQATGILLIAMAAVALWAGYTYDWKSGWCSGLCPVHPVEKLYGAQTAVSFENAHCTACKNCTVPCPDSTAGMHPLVKEKTPLHRSVGLLLAGGFPGFVWAWFQVPDYPAPHGWTTVFYVFALPFAGMLTTLLVFYALLQVVSRERVDRLVRVFALSAVGCYYWFRIPALIGFGMFQDDGMLIDLSASAPAWLPDVLRLAVLLFLVFWFFRKRSEEKSWSIRPAFEVVKKGR